MTDISRAVVSVLKTDHLAGEILLRLQRQEDDSISMPCALAWNGDDLILYTNPKKVAQSSVADLASLLCHIALHVAWQHPLRYADEGDPELVSMACDIAVNQYMENPPLGTFTLEQVERQLRRRLTTKVGSEYYLAVLRQLPHKDRESLVHNLNKANESFKGQRHQWLSGPQGNELVRHAHVTNVIHQSYQSLTNQQRGLIPGELRHRLGKSTTDYQVPLRKLLTYLIGQVPNGYEPSRARFNRRQPLRLELPGKVTKLVSPVYIFIDNSGSMADQTISQLLRMTKQMVEKINIEAVVINFDAQIQGQPYRLTRQDHIKMARHGGGGTSYQPIFNYLKDHHILPVTPVLILTDGWGESEINPYNYRNVVWLLTNDGELSVRKYPGTIYHLKERK